MNILEIVNNADTKQLAKYLNVATGTILRWKELKSVPKHYTFELLEYANIPIDYSKYSSIDKDQFFTTKEGADWCIGIVNNILSKYNDTLNDYTIIEPSAGDGIFIDVLLKNNLLQKYKAFDIEPRNSKVQLGNYLKLNPNEVFNTNNKYLVLGNPPFGLRGNLALKFINKSYEYGADYVCFILPQLFESDGKGVPRKE